LAAQKGCLLGVGGEVDTLCFLFLVPRPALQLTLKGVSHRPMHQNRVVVVGIFRLGELVARFYRPTFLPQTSFSGSGQHCFNMGSNRKQWQDY